MRGTDNGARIEQWRWEDVTEEQEFYLSEFHLEECAGGDALVTFSNSGFARRTYTPSGEETRQMHFRRDLLRARWVLYTGTMRSENTHLRMLAGSTGTSGTT